MRTERKAEANVNKKNKRLARGRKIAIFLLVFFLYSGLVIVDFTGSELTGYPPHLPLQVKRIDPNHISVMFWGINNVFALPLATSLLSAAANSE